MEINITRFMREGAPSDYSASRAELGDKAGEITWGHAVEDAKEWRMLTDEDDREQFRDHIRQFGAWDDDEIAEWSDDELEALLIQCISGDMRDAGLTGLPTDAEWAEYEAGAEQGTYSGRIMRSVTPGEVLYYIGS